MNLGKHRIGIFTALEAMNDDDLPDGAWWQVLEDTVTFCNEELKTNFDSNDVVHYWLNERDNANK